MRGREILRTSPLRSSKKVGAPKESRGRLDQPLPWIAAPSGLPTLAPGGRTGVGLSTARSGAGESEAVDPHLSETKPRGDASQVIATVVVVQSLEGFGSAEDPSEPVQTVNAA